MKRDLSTFSTDFSFTLIQKLRLAAWLLVQHLIFKSPFLPRKFRPYLLRLFGSSVGRQVIIRRGVLIHFPWNLELGNNCWVGEEVYFINHEKIKIGSDVCISQKSIICSSSHDFRTSNLKFSHKPINIKNGAWVCLNAKVLPGVTIGECSVVSAGEIAQNSVPDYSMLISGEIHPINLSS